jgi:hypothetical protein
MDSIVSFYNNLFTVEVAIFGIIAAAIFVFLQIVYSQFSYREVYGIFKNVFLILYLIISIITLVLTAFGSFLLSFPETNLTFENIFRNWALPFSLLLGFFLSIVLFIIFTRSNIRDIRPSKIALLISKKVSKNQIRDYLLKKYGITPPDHWLFLSKPDQFIVIRTVNDKGEVQEISEEEKIKEVSKKQELERELEEKKKIYTQATNSVAKKQDPMEPLDALMLRAINNVDLATVNEIQNLLVTKSIEFINYYKNTEDQKEWSPNSGLIRKYLDYLVELFKAHLVMSERQKLDSTKIKILETSCTIANFVISTSPGEVNVLLNLWKETADREIGKSREVFNKIIELYHRLLEYAFERGIEKNESCLDDIFRHLGWLTERLIAQLGIEQKPLMRNHDYYNEYDQIFETLLFCSDKYEDKYPTAYPLIYFDFVDVLFLQLIPIAKKSKNQKVEQNIFECLFIYYHFAEAAMAKNNSKGAALAITRLKELYEKLASEDILDCAKEGIDLMVRLGLAAFSYKGKLEHVDFLGNKGMEEYLMDIVAKSPYREKVCTAVYDSYLHSDYWDSKWGFILEMGKRLSTNFGFMFDWTTGEKYPDDDPRRR